MKFLPSSLCLALALAPLSGCGKKPEPAPGAPTTTSAPSTPTTPTTPTNDESGSPRRELEPDKGKTNDAPPPAGTLAVPELSGPFASPGLVTVPKSAPVVFVGFPKKFLDGFGYAGLFAKYEMLLGELSAPMVEITGKNFLKLESWAEIGIDLDKPMGVYMPELEREAFVSWVALSDGAKLVGFINDVAKKAGAPLSSEKVGEATLFTLGERDRMAWLVADGLLHTVQLMRGNGAAAMAKEILSRRDASGSILSLPELKSSLEGLGADEAGVFVQLRAILDKAVVPSLDKMPAMSTTYLEQALAEAKKGGDAAAIAAAEAALKSEVEFIERMNKRRAAEAALLKEMIADLSTLTIGFDLGEVSAVATARLPLKEGGLLRGLVRNASDMQPILKALVAEPLLVSSGQLDTAAYLSFVTKAMAADGDDLSEMKAAFKDKTGLDLEALVTSTFTGEIGFALTGDMATLLRNKDPEAELGGTLVVGLKNDKDLRDLVGKMSAMEGASEFVKWDAAAGVATIVLPNRKPISVAIQPNRLLASTDPEAGARLSGAGSGFVAGVSNPALKALYERKDLAALFTMPQSFLGGWLFVMGMRGSGYHPPMPADASAEVKAAHEALTKLDGEIEPLRARVEDARMKPLMDTLKKLGTMAWAASMDGQGVVGSWGIYTDGATVPEVVGMLIDAAMTLERRGEPSEDEKKLRELEDQRWKLESELWNTTRKVEEAVPPKVQPDE